MKQKLQDLKTLVTRDRRIWVGGGLLLLCMGIALLANNTGGMGSGRKKQLQDKGRPLGADVGEKTYHDLMHSLQARSNDLTQKVTSMQATQERRNKDSKETEAKLTGALEGVVENLDGLKKEIEMLRDKTSKPSLAVPTGATDQPDLEPETLAPFGDTGNAATILPPLPEPPRPNKITFIGPGDGVRVKLLSGVNAPVDQTPYPVVFQILDPIRGPDGSALDVGEARLTGAAQGSETEGRAYFRLSDLSFRHADGRRTVVKVDGWIVGEDGVNGMSGKLIDKLGQLIAATATAGGIAEFTRRLDRKNQSIVVSPGGALTVTGEDLQGAGASALTDTANRISSILLNRYEKLIPVVEVLSGREAVAVFSQPIEVSPCENEECEDGEYVTASLD